MEALLDAHYRDCIYNLGPPKVSEFNVRTITLNCETVYKFTLEDLQCIFANINRSHIPDNCKYRLGIIRSPKKPFWKTYYARDFSDGIGELKKITGKTQGNMLSIMIHSGCTKNTKITRKYNFKLCVTGKITAVGFKSLDELTDVSDLSLIHI